MRKLTAGERHLLQVIKKVGGSGGWAKISPPVATLFKSSLLGGMPEELCEFNPTENGGGWVRLTPLGEAVVHAMDWL